MIDYDDLYGISIDEYCKYHNITIDTLIDKVEKDIKLLSNHLHILIYEKEIPVNSFIVNEIYKLREKKEKHLKRLKEWKRGNV